jgi:hypothetical protein
MKIYFWLMVIGLSIFQVHADEIENTQAANLSVAPNITQDTIGKSWFSDYRRSYSRKGSFYIQAGFNWTGFGESDINFDGPGYDFTLEDLSGHDEPYKLSLQYNVHGGYFIRDNYSISLGFDHMKYVIDMPQQSRMSGQIDAQVSSPGIPSGQFEGNFDRQPITVTPDLLTLEYTDGFNYLSTHLSRYDDIWVSSNRKTSLALETGIGGGLVIPRSEVRLFGLGMNNKFNVAGWAGSVRGGLMLNFNRRVYFIVNLEAGYANMYRVHTTGRNDIDKASQKLNFLQNSYFIGYRF